MYFKPPNKAVILSEALRRSIANRGLYGAESKDPGDACWQMLLGAFRPRTAKEDTKSQPPSKAEGSAVLPSSPGRVGNKCPFVYSENHHHSREPNSPSPRR